MSKRRKLLGHKMPINIQSVPLCITTICIIGSAPIGYLALYAGCLNPVIILCAIIITDRIIWLLVYTIGIVAQQRTRYIRHGNATYLRALDGQQALVCRQQLDRPGNQEAGAPGQANMGHQQGQGLHTRDILGLGRTGTNWAPPFQIREQYSACYNGRRMSTGMQHT